MKLRLLRTAALATVSAVGLCSTAAAFTTGFPTGTAGPTGGIDNVLDTTFASEITAAAPVPNIGPGNNLNFLVVPTAVGTFPAGNSILTLTLNNGTFTTAVLGTAIDVAGSCGGGAFSAILSSGGSAGSNTVSFVLSNAQNCSNVTVPGQGPISIYLPVDVTTNGQNATISVSYVTDGNNPIDGGAPTNGALVWANFAPAFNFDTNSPPVTNPLIAQLPIYATLSANQLNDDFRGLVTPGRRLSNLNLADATNVLSATITVNGGTTGFSAVGGIDFASDYGTVTGLNIVAGAFTAALDEASATDLFVEGPQAWTFVPSGAGGIQTSQYTGTVNVNFDAGAALSPQSYGLTADADIASITRDGWSAVATWMTDGTKPNVDVIRLVATAATSGPVRAQLFTRAAGGAGATGATVVLAPSLAAGQELIINKESLIAAGLPNNYAGSAFGADLLITVEGPKESIVAQRLTALPGYGLSWIPLIDCSSHTTNGPISVGSC